MDPERPAEPPRTGPWGALATIFFTLTVAGLFLLVQIAVAIPYLIFKLAGTPQPDVEAAASGLESDGLLLGISEVVAGTAAIGFTVLLAWVRKGPRVRDYLALRGVPRPTILRWLLYTVLLGVALEGISYVAGYASVPVWMFEIYRSAGFLPLLLVAILVIAPVLEELVFRGFFFEGIRRTRLGDAGAILLASVLWAGTHVQYELFYMGEIFILGTLLGAARVRTGSIIPPILMHALFSVIAVIQVALEPAGRI
jgi:membrane protease YdiL (CAAX protease family)